jgi:hypothetical protein
MERTICLISVKGHPMRAVLAVLWVYFSFLHTIFAMIFFFQNRLWITTDHLANRHGPPVVCRPQFEKHWPNISVK